MRDLSHRMRGLPVQHFAALAPWIHRLQTSGVDVIRLDIASPDMPPPQQVIDALSLSAAQQDHHGYQDHRGIPRLRAAWASFYCQRFGVELDPDQEIVPLMGSKEGIFFLGQALLEPGAIALVPDPGYLTYANGTSFAGGEPYVMALREEHGYLPCLEDVPKTIADRARLLWLNYPNNPTGAVAEVGFFEEAVEFAREHDVLLCHDAAYTQVTYDGHRAPSILEIPGAKDVAIEFNTLSKSHNMAGWRAGVVVGNPQALEAIYSLKTHIDSGQFLPIMDACVQALTGDREWVEKRNEIYRRRRDLVAGVLRELGSSFLMPHGALYIWFTCPPGWTSVGFSEALLKDTGVSLAPGLIFGDQGRGFARLSFCAPEARLADAMARISDWWGQAVEEGGEHGRRS